MENALWKLLFYSMPCPAIISNRKFQTLQGITKEECEKTSTQNCTQPAQDVVANSKHTKWHAQGGKKQARSLNQGLKSTVDACFTSQTEKSTVSAEWANMLQANNLGQESSEMVCFKPTKIKTGLLHYFAKHCGISWFSAISWKVQTQRMNIRLD